MFPEAWEALVGNEQGGQSKPEPHLLLFTFSPVQEFIKASRKFLDFWAGSYLLHYLSADLCWFVAQRYGADTLITPSLWGQEIIDAFILKQYPEWSTWFIQFQSGKDPVSRFHERSSTSLSTAGFPNTLTLLAGSKEETIKIGEALAKRLSDRWKEIANQVKEDIKHRVSDYVSKNYDQIVERLRQLNFFNPEDIAPYLRELQHYTQPGCWEWNKLWEAQINHSWEPYFVVVPLGHPGPDTPLQILTEAADVEEWIEAQNILMRAKQNEQGQYRFPSQAEKEAYRSLNVGTWWGGYQARLGQLIQSVKNTRNWKIPVAPGERSSISGQYSAVHPRFKYEKFQHGRGMTAGSLRLFWWVIAEAYQGLFNGSEKLNAIELTKRMAWGYSDLGETLGILEEISNLLKDSLEENPPSAEDTEQLELEESPSEAQTADTAPQVDYEQLIRFPNLSSIAAARFACDHPEQLQRYWEYLRKQISEHTNEFSRKQRRAFYARTRRPMHIPNADAAIRTAQRFNGVMFSSKWLADDLNLTNDQQLSTLRRCVDRAHQQAGFGDGSPSDWWVLVLGDGDGMGKYVSGSKLNHYRDYLQETFADRTQCPDPLRALSDGLWQELMDTKKRMGPATHIGLNRALLDFSNRLVPHLTERRYCGRVIYSGGDDVMAALPLADLPGFLRSLRAAWSGQQDPENEFADQGGYWQWQSSGTRPPGIPDRPLFTMGKDATMSLGVVIAHKSVPLPTVLEKLWEAEKSRAKEMKGGKTVSGNDIPDKDGLCFRVIYGSGNTLEALMKGHLLEPWWEWVQTYENQKNLSPLLYRLAETIPLHAQITADNHLISLVAKVVMSNRDEQLPEDTQTALLDWLEDWEQWAWATQAKTELGNRPEDLANLLRFTAFWVSRRQQELSWLEPATAALVSQ
jgi:CRISPR-associated protein Cmr2